MIKDRLFIKFSLAKIILFMIAITTFSEFFLRKYIINNDIVYQNSKLFKKKKSKNTIWGDSASMQSINFLKQFNNFSGPSDNYQEIEKKIKNYYSNFSEGKVILHLSLNAFAKYRDRGIREEDLSFYLSNREPNLFISQKRFQERLFRYYGSFIKNNFNVKHQFIINSDGSAAEKRIFVPPKNIKINPNNKYYPKLEFKYDENYKALLRITDYLLKKDIKLCFITGPIQVDYREKRLNMNKFKKVRKFYNDFALNKKIKYYDFVEYELPLKYFADEIHLNNEGSKFFTDLIKNTCKFS